METSWWTICTFCVKKLSQNFCLWRKNDKYHTYFVCRDHIRKDVMTQCSVGVCGLCVAAHVCSPRLSVAAVNIIWKLFLDAIASPSTYLPSGWVSNVFRFWRWLSHLPCFRACSNFLSSFYIHDFWGVAMDIFTIKYFDILKVSISISVTRKLARLA